MDKFIEVHTDGSCSKPYGKGGWAFVIVDNHKVIFSDWGCNSSTTNNRMELQAVISALEYLKDKTNLKVYSDSQYVINGISKWIYGWIKNNWRNNEIKNQDLWKHLLELIQGKSIIWKWEKGHNGNKYNEIADKLAKEGSKK